MPSAVLRKEPWEINKNINPNDTPGLQQWPEGSTSINAYNIDYRYTPSENPLLDVKAGLWSTHTRTRLLNAASVYAPKSQRYPHNSDYAWSPQTAFNFGANLSNTAKWENGAGKWQLVTGADYKRERVKPQKGVEIDLVDKHSERVIRDATRWEGSLFSNLEYTPVEALSLRVGGRYSKFENHDHNRWGSGGLFCTENQCLPTGFNPFPDGSWVKNRRDITQADLDAVSPLEAPKSYKGHGFAPSFGLTWRFAKGSQAYINYLQGIRLPAQFETSMGTANVRTTASLAPERARNLEIGVSTVQNNLLSANDRAMFKLAYFRNNYKNYITRFLDPTEYFTSSQYMYFRNLDRFKVSGFEANMSYDAGYVFADLSATYYQKAQACDRFISQRLSQNPRIGHVPYCVDGGFGSSYAAAQNPPKYMYSLTAGTRLLGRKLTLGGRVTHTDGPIATMDKPYHKVVTTYQKHYKKVTTVDLFSEYKIGKNASLNFGVTNLTNRYYLDPLAQSYIPAPGRNWTIGFEAKF